MKTLLLTPEIFSSEGGIQRIMRVYLKALSEHGPEAARVSLLSLNDSQFSSTDLRRYSNQKLAAWQACGRNKKRFIHAALRLAPDHDHLICGHINQLPVALLARLRRPSLRITLIAHGIEVWRPYRLIERLALRATRDIWCVSEFTRQQLHQHAPFTARKTVVLPNALDPYFPIESPTHVAPPPAPVILAIARLDQSESYKGIDHLLAAWPSVIAELPSARLHIIGRGNDLPRLQSFAQKSAAAHAIRFLGSVPDSELNQALASCHAFALPSEKEGFGLVYLEAMAHGRPCIVAQSGGAPEVITPATGILVPYNNPPALTQACLEALCRDWDPAAIIARAEHFSYSNFRLQLAKLLPA